MLMRVAGVVGFIAVLVLSSFLSAAESLAPIGVAKVDITPNTPVRMYGYASRKIESEGVAGRLNASALVIGGDEGPGPAVMLCVDNGAIPTRIRQEVLRRLQQKMPLLDERFMLCNTHIHSGPDLAGMNGLEGQQLEHMAQYAAFVTDQLESVVLKAAAARKPARLSWTVGTVEFAANRRVLKDGKWSGFGAVPEGAADHDLRMLRVTDEKDQVVAIVLSYACHNTTLRPNFTKIHADWSGCAQEAIESNHPGVIAMVSLGCGADSDPRPHGTAELCAQHGREIADEVKRLLAGPFKSIEPRITSRSTTLHIPCDAPPSTAELKELAAKSYAGSTLLRRVEAGEPLPKFRDYSLATWTFGNDLAMVFLSNEVVVDYAKRIARDFDGQRVWVNAYTNEVACYIPSDRVIGEGGYEVINSLTAAVTYGRTERLKPSLEDRIVSAVRDLLPAQYKPVRK